MDDRRKSKWPWYWIIFWLLIALLVYCMIISKSSGDDWGPIWDRI